MKCALYNVPYSASFFEVLAQKFLNTYKDKPLELANVLFLVPNKRSVQNLKEAFLQTNDMTAFLLPEIVPVYDANEDEIFFESSMEDFDLPAAISDEERLFLFAKLIAAQKSVYGIEHMSYAQSLSLAAYLAKLIDDAANEDCCFDNLKDIVPEQYAAHWQVNLDFLKIVTAYWPNILKERNLIDACQRRNLLIQKKADNWVQNPGRKIVAAGLSVPFKTLKAVIKALGQTENAEIYIYGLDNDMPDAAWEVLSKTHPQYAKKELLNILEANRADVQTVAEKRNVNREKLVSEVMREAETTDSWRFIKDNEELKDGTKGIGLIEAEDSFEEALAIALIMREVLETPNKTAALVTPDRNLARMTASALKRFGVEIDDSAGLPLHLSPIGIYLRQILDVLENDFSASSVAALLKNDLFRMGKSAEKIRQQVREAEYEKRMPRYEQKTEGLKQDALDAALKKAFANLKALYEKEKVPLETLIKEHIKLAENLAADDVMTGAQNLWRHEDGRTCAAAVADILEHAGEAENILPKEYGAVFLTLISRYAVRKPYGTHPRLKILGLIEARFCSFDVMIAGSLNEGVWPKAMDADPFMSRAMKEAFGLPAPEKQTAQTADDLCGILNAKEVYLTRALRCEGAPTNKSRYWLRFETVVKALGLEVKEVSNDFYLSLAQKINQTAHQKLMEPVAPRPPVSARPRKFSASSFKKWMKNPYDIYAEKILGLKPLEDLDLQPSSKDFGNLMHRALDRFCKKYPAALDENAEQTLKALVKEEIDEAEADFSTKVFWSGKAEKMIAWFLENAPDYRDDVKHITTETWGKMTFKGPAGDVLFKTRADYVAETSDGFYKIGDYKTGSYAQKSDVLRGFEPQLPIEGLIAMNGGFEDENGKLLPPKPIKNLAYFALGKDIVYVGEKKPQMLEDTLKQTQEHIQKMIDAFDDENTPYLFNPNPNNINEYSEYEHLARVKEWKGNIDTNDKDK